MAYIFEHGIWVVDVVTGFGGFVIGRCDYITGCNQYLLQPRVDAADKYVDSRWVDEARLKQTSEYKLELPNQSSNRGADKPAPKK